MTDKKLLEVFYSPPVFGHTYIFIKEMKTRKSTDIFPSYLEDLILGRISLVGFLKEWLKECPLESLKKIHSDGYLKGKSKEIKKEYIDQLSKRVSELPKNSAESKKEASWIINHIIIKEIKKDPRPTKKTERRQR